MFAAIATFAFLAAIWLIATIAAQMVAESGGKIAAALKGRSLLATSVPVAPLAVRVSLRSRPQPALRVQPQWRAAA